MSSSDNPLRFIYYASDSHYLHPKHKLTELLEQLFLLLGSEEPSIHAQPATKEQCLQIIRNSPNLCMSSREKDPGNTGAGLYSSILNSSDERNSMILALNDEDIATSVVVFRYNVVPVFKSYYGYGDIIFVEYLCSTPTLGKKGEGSYLLSLLKKLALIIKSNDNPIIGLYLQVADIPGLSSFYEKNGFKRFITGQYYIYDMSRIEGGSGNKHKRKINCRSKRKHRSKNKNKSRSRQRKQTRKHYRK